MKALSVALSIVISFAIASAFLFTTASQAVAIPGGFSPGSKTAPETLAAAKFAVAERSKVKGAVVELVAIESVEQQVVAGMNYKLHLSVKIDGKVQKVTAMVWRKVPVSKGYELTSWEP